MFPRVLLITVTALILMSATCKKVDCTKLGLDKCDFSMKEIEKSSDGQYTAITGRRVCNGTTVSQEVVVYVKGESLNNKCGNAYATIDTLAPLHIEWTVKGLKIFTNGYKSRKTILREKKVYDVVDVEYSNSVK